MRMEFLREEGEARVLRVSAVLPDGSPSVVEVFGPRGWRDHGVARELTVRPVRRVDEFLEVVLRPAEAACSLAVESAASLRAALAAGVPE